MDTCQSPLNLSEVSPVKTQAEVCSHCSIPSLCWLPLPSYVRLLGAQRRLPTGSYSSREQGGQPGAQGRCKQHLPKGDREQRGQILTLKLAGEEMGHEPCQRALSQQLRLGKTATLHMVHSLLFFPTPRMLYILCQLFSFPPYFNRFFSSMRGTEHPLPAQCHRNPSQLRHSCSRETKADHGTAK